ncbi:MAG: hypothetical protein DRO11_05585 [Methanobacteriota archaeon]|nr:MAG: hypothetical protein DRO11_05585 [Euryarchaeota archaeon]
MAGESGEDELERSLRYSIREGAAQSVMLGFGEYYLSPYAVALRATGFQVGVLSSLPRLLGALSQLGSSRVLKLVGARKPIITTTTLLQALMWLPILCVMLLDDNRVWYLIFFAVIYHSLGGFQQPVWTSLIGDIVPKGCRGKYFGKRNCVTGLTSFLSIVLAGLLLDHFTELHMVYGFIPLFLVAFYARLVSNIYMKKIYEPPYKPKPGADFSFLAFLARMGKTNYGLFVLYLSLMSFAVQIAAPYFVVYMLEDLGFTYLEYMVVTSSAAITSFLSMTLWGNYTDLFGNKTILRLTGLLIPLIPILWLVSSSVPYLIAVQAFSGFIWAGFNLSAFNFIFDTTSPEKRARCVAYYNVLNGLAIFSGAMFGGALLRLEPVFWSRIHLLFMVSGVSRFLVSLSLLSKIREVREVDKLTGAQLVWRIFAVEPVRGLRYLMVAFRNHNRNNKNRKP